MTGGAVETFKGVVVPILRNMAWDANSVVPESAIRAYTIAGGYMIDHVHGARLAYSRGSIEVLSGIASGALSSVKERHTRGAGHT